jgi:hypothetical protein
MSGLFSGFMHAEVLRGRQIAYKMALMPSEPPSSRPESVLAYRMPKPLKPRSPLAVDCLVLAFTFAGTNWITELMTQCVLIFGFPTLYFSLRHRTMRFGTQEIVANMAYGTLVSIGAGAAFFGGALMVASIGMSGFAGRRRQWPAIVLGVAFCWLRWLIEPVLRGFHFDDQWVVAFLLPINLAIGAAGVYGLFGNVGQQRVETESGGS